ncbi:MAG: tetratricopeptide repeat protein [Bacteroidetes bacterium]|nr:tetratricopeptide repeat protein [Bacteroidota bacterium]
MVSRFAIAIMLVLFGLAGYSQGVSKEEADSLLKSLPAGRTDGDEIDIFLKVAEYYIYKAGEYKADFDKAKEYMQKAAFLNKRVKSEDANAFQLLLESQIDKENRLPKVGKVKAETALSRLIKGKNKFYLGTAYFCLSDYYSYSDAGESIEKRRLVELAVQSFEQTNNIEQLAYSLKFLADLYALNDEREKALEKLGRVLPLYESIHYTALQGVYILYSNIYFTDGNYKTALNYGLMALKNAQTGGDTSMSVCQINNYVGIILNRLKENERAIDYYQAAMKVAEKYNDNDAVLEVMANAVRSYVELKKPEEALSFMRSVPKRFLKPGLDESYMYVPMSYLVVYGELKRYAEVQTYCDQILQEIKVHRPSDKLLHDFYSLLIGFYLQTRQYASASLFIGRIDSLSKKIGDPNRVKEGYYLKYRLDTARELYKSASENLLKYQIMNDSLFTETASRQMKQLEVEYETEKNRNEIKLRDQSITMLNQKNQLQQSSLERTSLVKNFTIGAAVFLFIIMGLLYRQYWIKQHTNKIVMEKNEQLQHLVSEKDWLVKEIHHRVKNNFHVVASLLEIQSSYLKNKEALSAIKESQNRIHSMSIIHQKLYQSETLSTIHMPEYIYELVEFLRESYAIRDDVVFTLDIENMELNHGVAISLGLILNEAITNAIKYAFVHTGKGKISISLNHISEGWILLNVADNGQGLPADFKSKFGATMGMELLQGLTDDMGGNFSIETNNGTHIKIIFSEDPKRAGKMPVAGTGIA